MLTEFKRRKCSAVEGVHIAKKHEMAWRNIQLAANASVWNHFGFYEVKAKKDVDKSHTICKLCQTKLQYFGNTTNMRNHIKRFHPEEEEKQLVVAASNQRTIEQCQIFRPTRKERSELQTLLQL